MIRPSVTLFLFLAIALFIVLNDAVGDTWIGPTLPVRVADWYKTLVPLPYVAMLAIIHARRTAGPRWFEAALLAALLWPTSTVLVDFLYARVTYDDDPAAFLDRFAFWWGAPYPLLVWFCSSRRCSPGCHVARSSFSILRASADMSFGRVSSFSSTTAAPYEAQVFPTCRPLPGAKKLNAPSQALDNRAQCCGLFLPILSPRGSASCSATPPRNRFMKLR